MVMLVLERESGGLPAHRDGEQEENEYGSSADAPLL
jgi:hypothetical protein